MHEYSNEPSAPPKPEAQRKAERRQRFLKDLDKKVAAFKELCNTSVCADDFPESLVRLGASGRYLLAGIEDLINHATDLKARLDRNTGDQG